MNLNESTVEDAALEWFGELGYHRWRSKTKKGTNNGLSL